LSLQCSVTLPTSTATDHFLPLTSNIPRTQSVLSEHWNYGSVFSH
jgi:hypothetical protein